MQPYPAIVSVTVGDRPEVWSDLGFTVAEGAVLVGGVRIELDPQVGPGLRRWALAGVTFDGGLLDGLPTEVVAPPATAGVAVEHPNGVHEIDHVVLASADVDRTARALEAAGLERRRERRTDTYGAPMRQVFFRPAGAIVELIGPDEPPAEGADRPPRFYGLAFTSRDLDRTVDMLGGRIHRAKAAVQAGRRIATVDRSAGSTVAMAVMSPHVPGDEEE